jgi:hypothetical protein
MRKEFPEKQNPGRPSFKQRVGELGGEERERFGGWNWREENKWGTLEELPRVLLFFFCFLSAK